MVSRESFCFLDIHNGEKRVGLAVRLLWFPFSRASPPHGPSLSVAGSCLLPDARPPSLDGYRAERLFRSAKSDVVSSQVPHLALGGGATVAASTARSCADREGKGSRSFPIDLPLHSRESRPRRPGGDVRELETLRMPCPRISQSEPTRGRLLEPILENLRRAGLRRRIMGIIEEASMLRGSWNYE